MSTEPALHSLIKNLDSQLAEVIRNSAVTGQREIPEQERLTKYILVAVDNLHLAVAIEDLSEVGPLPSITFLPNLPFWIQGIVNIRSEIISVIDFMGFLDKESKDTREGNRLLVLQFKKRKVGIRIDRIVGTVSRTISDLQAISPDNVRGAEEQAHFSSSLSMDNLNFNILDVRKFLSSPKLLQYNRYV